MRLFHKEIFLKPEMRVFLQLEFLKFFYKKSFAEDCIFKIKAFIFVKKYQKIAKIEDGKHVNHFNMLVQLSLHIPM